MNSIEGGGEDDERTAEEELARSIDRPAEAIKYLKDAVPPLETCTLAAAMRGLAEALEK